MSPKPRQRSLSTRLTVALVVAVTILAIAVSCLLYAYASRTLRRDFDESLTARCQAMASLVQDRGDGTVVFDFTAGFMPEYSDDRGIEYFQVWLPDGKVLERSRSLRAQELPKLAGSISKPALFDVFLPHDRKGRAAGVRFIPQLDVDARDEGGQRVTATNWAGGEAVLVVARNTHGLNRALQKFARLLALGAALLPLLAAGQVLLIVRLGMRPVRGLARQVEQIGSSTLAARLDSTALPRELAPIAEGLNRSLERLEAAFARERRFTTDVSHELKTPLAEAMSALSVAARWPDDPALVTESCRDGLAALHQMNRLIATLQEIARADAATEAIQLQEAALGQAIREAAASHGELASQRQVALCLDIDDRAAVLADPVLLASIAGNLIGNAVKYAPPGSEVVARVAAGPSQATLSVTNPAPSLDPADLDVMFQPFWRKDPARADCATSSGLGLTIAASFARLLGATVEARLLPGNNLEVSIALERPKATQA